MATVTSTPRWQARFFTIWTGQALSLLGSALVQFALIWWLTAQTGSATVLATATLVALLPQAMVSPIAGAIVDRGNRRLIMILADSAIALSTLGLAALFATGSAQIWHIYALMAIRSVCGAFHGPAMMASTSLMVPEAHLARVSGINQSLHGVISIAAPPLGALLMTLAPMQGVLMIDVVTASMAVLPLFFVTVPQPQRAAVVAGAARSSLLDDLRAGIRFVLAWPGLRMVMLIGLVLNFWLVPASSLTPLLISRHFQGGAPELALIEAFWGIGLIAGGVLLGLWGGFKRRILTSMLGLAGLAFGFLLMGLTPASMLWLAVAAMALLGFSNPLTNGPIMAIMQSNVPADMQGRVMSLMMTVSIAIVPISLLLAGPVADTIGVQAWFLIGGVGCAVMTIVGLLSPALMTIDEGGRNSAAPILSNEPHPETV